MNKLACCCAIFFVVLVIAACRHRAGTTGKPESHTDMQPATAPQLQNPYSPVDLSPLDMSYFPVNYSQRKMSGDLHTPPDMRVIYSRPHRQGRAIFGDLLKYGEPWRLGANEASEIEFFRDVSIQNKKINAGRYVIYCIPYQGKWTMILNSDLYTWGLKIDSTKDIARFDIPIENAPTQFEFFTMVFQPIAGGAALVMAWDNTEARLPIEFL
ncbi:MAG TPA: DUF2911 domain-containing protein [Chitinophagaceae bacterium]|jgi:hypothetical protein